MPICKLSEGVFINTDQIGLAWFAIKGGAVTGVRIMLPVGNEIRLGKEDAQALHEALERDAQKASPAHVLPFDRYPPKRVGRPRKVPIKQPSTEDDFG
jgi:hypothetical protein